MPDIPLTNKIHTVAAGVETVNKGSAQANAGREAFTIQDLADTIDAGTIDGDSGFIPLYTSSNSIGNSLLTQATIAGEEILFFGGGATPLVARILKESVLRIESQDAAPTSAATAGSTGDIVLYHGDEADVDNGIYVCVVGGAAGDAHWAKSALTNV